MTTLPELECWSSNVDSVVLTWHGRAPRYKVEYKQINKASIGWFSSCACTYVLLKTLLLTVGPYVAVAGCVDFLVHLTEVPKPQFLLDYIHFVLSESPTSLRRTNGFYGIIHDV